MLGDLRANSFFTVLRTWLRGELVGVDDRGNRYYRERGSRDGGSVGWRKERRWVVFARDPDPTLVPPPEPVAPAIVQMGIDRLFPSVRGDRCRAAGR